MEPLPSRFFLNWILHPTLQTKGGTLSAVN